MAQVETREAGAQREDCPSALQLGSARRWLRRAPLSTERKVVLSDSRPQARMLTVTLGPRCCRRRQREHAASAQGVS